MLPTGDAHHDRGQRSDCAQATDPVPFTSRLGANEVSTKVGRMEKRAAEIVRLHPNKTGSELDRICGYTRRELSKRLRGAQRKGLVLADGHRKCRVTGRKAITWSVP